MAGYSVTYSVVDNASKQIDAINRRITAMRAPMERLSKQVTRFVDVSGLNTIAKGFASIGRAAQSVLRTLVEIVPVLGTLTGAATIAGMVKLVGTYADWSQKLVSTADNLGTTTQQLQQFEDAGRLAGGRTEDMDAALKSLYQAQGNFIVGKGGDATLWANQLGIAFKDATGHARSMADLMPEVVRKVSEIKDPYDRAAAATALLGDKGNDLVETFRRSHQSFGQWLTDASRYTELSDKQKDQLQAFAEAQGHIATAFDHLGQQISATLAANFTPLLNTLADFVTKNQPQIIAAVAQISDEFKNWIDGIDWGQVKEDINGVTSLLRTMLEVAEAIGKAIEKTMFLFGLTNRKFTKEDVLQNSPFYAQLTPEQQKMVRQQVGISEADYAKGQQPQPGVSITQHPLDWLGNRLFRGGQGNEGYQTPTGRGPAPSQQPGFGAPAQASPAAPINATSSPGTDRQAFFDEQRTAITEAARRAGVAHPEVVGQLGATQASLESGFGKSGIGPGGYNVYGIKSGGGVGSGSVSVPTHEQINGQLVAMNQDFATFKDRNEAADAYVDFLKKNPRYSGVLNASTVEQAISAQGHSGYATASNYESSLAATYAAHGGGAPTQLAQASPLPVPPVPPAQAPPATVPSPVPVNGSVDVNITGKNMPPNTAITASGTGSGVNVAPPRVERQELASI